MFRHFNNKWSGTNVRINDTLGITSQLSDKKKVK